MCKNMKELQSISEEIYELEKKKASYKKKMDDLDKKIKELKSETSDYMKKRQKNILPVGSLEILFTPYTRPLFDKDAFIAGEENGQETYNKYLKTISIERVTVRIAKNQL